MSNHNKFYIDGQWVDSIASRHFEFGLEESLEVKAMIGFVDAAPARVSSHTL
jgi:hypothetical protein